MSMGMRACWALMATFCLTSSQLGAQTVSTTASDYTPSQDVVITYQGLPPGSHWVDVCMESAGDTEWGKNPQYTDSSCETRVTGLEPGTYEVRIRDGRSYEILARSRPFTVGLVPRGGGRASSPTIRTLQATYFTTDGIAVEWSRLPGNRGELLSICRKGAPDRFDPSHPMHPTMGKSSGSHVFQKLPVGEYELRLHYTVPKREHILPAQTFSVRKPPKLGLKKKGMHYTNEPVTVTWSDLSPIGTQVVTICNASHSDQDYKGIHHLLVTADKKPKGDYPFPKLPFGAYEARLYTMTASSGFRIQDRVPFMVAKAKAAPSRSITLMQKLRESLNTQNADVVVFFETALRRLQEGRHETLNIGQVKPGYVYSVFAVGDDDCERLDITVVDGRSRDIGQAKHFKNNKGELLYFVPTYGIRTRSTQSYQVRVKMTNVKPRKSAASYTLMVFREPEQVAPTSAILAPQHTLQRDKIRFDLKGSIAGQRNKHVTLLLKFSFMNTNNTWQPLMARAGERVNVDATGRVVINLNMRVPSDPYDLAANGLWTDIPYTSLNLGPRKGANYLLRVHTELHVTGRAIQAGPDHDIHLLW